LRDICQIRRLRNRQRWSIQSATCAFRGGTQYSPQDRHWQTMSPHLARTSLFGNSYSHLRCCWLLLSWSSLLRSLCTGQLVRCQLTTALVRTPGTAEDLWRPYRFLRRNPCRQSLRSGLDFGRLHMACTGQDGRLQLRTVPPHSPSTAPWRRCLRTSLQCIVCIQVALAELVSFRPCTRYRPSNPYQPGLPPACKPWWNSQRYSCCTVAARVCPQTVLLDIQRTCLQLAGIGFYRPDTQYRQSGLRCFEGYLRLQVTPHTRTSWSTRRCTRCTALTHCCWKTAQPRNLGMNLRPMHSSHPRTAPQRNRHTLSSQVSMLMCPPCTRCTARTRCCWKTAQPRNLHKAVH
jgi:hypothetical protein